MQWKATLAKPTELLLSLIEDVVFATELDAAIFIACKQRKQIDGLLEMSPFADKVAAIDEALKERQKGDKYAMDIGVDEAANETGTAGVTTADLAALNAEGNTDPPAAVTQEMEGLKHDSRSIVQKYVSTCWNKI